MKSKIILLLLLLSIFIFGGCSSFVGDESLEISSITTEQLEDGSTIITIKYTDEDISPVKFTIPAGKVGPIGNGIKDILITKSEDGSKTFLEILYTQEGTLPIKVELENGVSVVGVEEEYDEATSKKYLVVKYSDGTKSERIELASGADGATFAGFNTVENEDGSITVFIKFRSPSGEIDSARIDVPKGEKGDDGSDGRGIASIVSMVVGDEYVITVTYNDGDLAQGIPATKEELKFTRPTKWLTGSGIPDNSLGIDGDFYYDTTNKDIYLKAGIWKLEVDLDSNGSKGNQITFDLNDHDSDVKASMQHPGSTYLTTQTFYESRKDIPEPTREGYKFIGWYTRDNSSVNSTKLEDLTVITCDIIVYAIWEKIN